MGTHKMQIYTLALLFLPFAGSAVSAGNKKLNRAELRTARTIFIDGNNESGDKLREKLETSSCFTLSNNKSHADAIMTTEERRTPHETNEVVTSVTITMPNGDQVWTRTKKGGAAAEDLLHDLAKEGCPKWKGWKRKSN